MTTFIRIIIVAIIGALAEFSMTSAQTPDSLLPNHTFFLAADFAGLLVYTGTAAVDVDIMFNGWLGVRAGVGTSYALYEGTATGFAFGLKLMTPPRAESSGRLEVSIGGSYMKITREGSGTAAYEWLPLVSIGAMIELTKRGSATAVFGRAGVGYLYYYGVPFYIGWGVAF